MTFGAQLKNARQAARMTQPETARLLDVSTQTVSNWECERSTPWPSQQDKLLAAIGAKAVAVEPLAPPAGRRRISDLI